MCFILTSLKIKDNPDCLYPILKLLTTEQSGNRDGTGAYCFNLKDEQTSYHRTMTAEHTTMAYDLKNFDVCNYHFRMGSSGSKDERNIHFWKIGDWLFAHNGTATDHVKGEMTDSYNLFSNLIQKHLIKHNGKIDFEGIKKFINSTTFWGRFIIINTKSNKMYFFGDWHCYVINKSYMVLTSAKSDFETYQTFLGISFEDPNTTLEVLETEIDGMFYFDPKSGFTQVDTDFKAKYWNNYYKKTNDYKSYDEYMANNQEDSDYTGEVKELTDWYEKKSQEICAEGFTDENLAELDKLEDEMYFKLDEIDLKYAEAETKKEKVKTKQEKKEEQRKLYLVPKKEL